ncbi:hypothetical protein Taro_042200 [Colocasia esculenta]|uniref:Uncharacterized protein n=1 Tax=Colocasia esculenta TaxID=4460 RepID=A0A843WVT9_COLES|nr:hypothetical protein [Colocasia esculenta]
MTTAPPPPPDAHRAAAEKSHLEKEGSLRLEHTRRLEYSLNRRTGTGVPANGNNLSHGTSPQVPSTG